MQNSGSLDYRTYPTPRYRFDAPAGEYPTIYTNDSRVGVFAEVYVDRGRRLGSEDAGRRLVEIEPERPLPVVDLLSDNILTALDLDERISTGEDYERCQQWALALYETLPELCGIRYGARCAGRATANLALFADRCASNVALKDHGRLEDLPEVVLAATDRYKLRAAFLT